MLSISPLSAPPRTGRWEEVSDFDAPCFEHHREVYLFKFLALPLDYKALNLRQLPFSVLGTLLLS